MSDDKSKTILSYTLVADRLMHETRRTIKEGEIEPIPPTAMVTQNIQVELVVK